MNQTLGLWRCRDVTEQAKICMKVCCKGEKEPSRQNLQPLSVRPTFNLGNIQTEMDSFTFLSLLNLNICRSTSLNRMNDALGTVLEMCYKRALFLLVLNIKTPTLFKYLSVCHFSHSSRLLTLGSLPSWLLLLLTRSLQQKLRICFMCFYFLLSSP